MAGRRIAGSGVAADERELTAFLKFADELVDVVEHCRGKLELATPAIRGLGGLCTGWLEQHGTEGERNAPLSAATLEVHVRILQAALFRIGEEVAMATAALATGETRSIAQHLGAVKEGLVKVKVLPEATA